MSSLGAESGRESSSSEGEEGLCGYAYWEEEGVDILIEGSLVVGDGKGLLSKGGCEGHGLGGKSE